MVDYVFSGNILCIGSINMDLVMEMDHLPGPGETLKTDSYMMYPGGKGGNQAATAAKLGGNVSFFGRLGEDYFSKELLRSLSKQGVNVHHVTKVSHGIAGLAMIRVDRNGQNSISFTPGSNSTLSRDDVIAGEFLFESGGILLLTMEIPTETVYTAIRIAKKNNMFVILDPAPAPQTEIPEDIPDLVDIIKPNESEASVLSGIRVKDIKTAYQAGEKLLQKGFYHPIITLGENGMIAFLENGWYRVEPHQVNTIDSTAAGDIFLGALAVQLSKEFSLGDSIQYANISASLSTTKKGAQSSIPFISEIQKELCKIKPLTHLL